MHNENVRGFFDKIAADYASRYTNKRPFLNFFHRQRIETALCEVEIEGKKIWDLGAGTAVLSHFLAEEANRFDYFASDISEKMFEVSGLSSQSYFVGKASEAPAYFTDFDLVFLLGVTTYMKEEELQSLFGKLLPERMSEGSKLVVTFTHAGSLDFQLRKRIKFVLRKVLPPDSVVSQTFKVNAYSVEEASTLVQENFIVNKVVYLNPTIPFLNRLFPRLGVRMGRILSDRKDNFLKRFLASDFQIIASLAGSLNIKN